MLVAQRVHPGIPWLRAIQTARRLPAATSPVSMAFAAWPCWR
jgi:hypothetical protein